MVWIGLRLWKKGCAKTTGQQPMWNGRIARNDGSAGLSSPVVLDHSLQMQ